MLSDFALKATVAGSLETLLYSAIEGITTRVRLVVFALTVHFSLRRRNGQLENYKRCNGFLD